ncbi:ribosomal RNA-processing protein 7 homolog A isoform X1 [Xenopus laevis]|uniref:Ribosomal RNA-processing protein 7 homolog A isoform X1 n=1 Tax=Xenopus laevis TaxID=8355 RepID=A0A8J0UXR7_XENLA|nr:ribosomal RNA-processing protein 7 homolog A isoform X1 [Xenopus laevis]
MAPAKQCSTFEAPPGYTAVPVKFSEERRTHHYLYIKEHKVREDLDQTRPQNRTLFVLNVPPYCTKESLSQIFTSCSPVESIELQDKPGPSEAQSSAFSKHFGLKHLNCPHPARRGQETRVPQPLQIFRCCPTQCRTLDEAHISLQGFKVAYVVFKHPSGVQAFKSFKVKKPVVLSGVGHSIKTGINKWIDNYQASLTDVAELQAEVDEFMKGYDERVAEEEEKAKEEEGVPDEEGWVKVTRKGRRPGLARTEAVNIRVTEKEKRKRAQKELLNFYAWQHRESKREHLAELRKKFEEDKQKIALMRAQRKFRPY